MDGKVKFFNELKGFGFIYCAKDDKDYFVHKTNTLETITKDDIVVFSLKEGKKGIQAVDVRIKT